MLLGINKNEAVKGNSTSREKASFKDKIIDAKDFNEIVAISGYRAREHVVTTRDGYLLVVHKLEKIHSDFATYTSKPVVYMHHGLLTNSELWVLGSTKEKTLPYLLVDAGYDVYLGNNRGNKYSRKHLKLSASDPKFWDFLWTNFRTLIFPIPLSIFRTCTKPRGVTTSSQE